MPIKGLTENKRLPRIGKIRLGVKKTSLKTGKEYPTATDYFVCPPEVQKVYGEKPKELDIIIPVEDDETWASQYYRQYSRTQGLVCKGTGETCDRKIDMATGAIAGRDTKEAVWKEKLPCQGKECPDYKAKKCGEVMNLQFMLPKVPGLGVWQIGTGSINSIMNINSCAQMVRAVCGRISWVPITLVIEPVEVNNPDDGKKKIVHCLNLRHKQGLSELLALPDKPRMQLLIAAPVDDEAPEDNEPRNEKVVEALASIVEPKTKSANELEQELFPEPAKAAAQTSAPSAEPKTKPARDPLSITNFGELYAACQQDFGIKARQLVWKELGVSQQTEISDTPAECYRKIAEVYKTS